MPIRMFASGSVSSCGEYAQLQLPRVLPRRSTAAAASGPTAFADDRMSATNVDSCAIERRDQVRIEAVLGRVLADQIPVARPGRSPAAVSRGSSSPPAARYCGYARFIALMRRGTARTARVPVSAVPAAGRSRRASPGSPTNRPRPSARSAARRAPGRRDRARAARGSTAAFGGSGDDRRPASSLTARSTAGRVDVDDEPALRRRTPGRQPLDRQPAVVAVQVVGDVERVARVGERRSRSAPRARGPTSTATSADSRSAGNRAAAASNTRMASA